MNAESRPHFLPGHVVFGEQMLRFGSTDPAMQLTYIHYKGSCGLAPLHGINLRRLSIRSG